MAIFTYQLHKIFKEITVFLFLNVTDSSKIICNRKLNQMNSFLLNVSDSSFPVTHVYEEYENSNLLYDSILENYY